MPLGILLSFVLLTSCFAFWGLANNMTDTLLSAFKRIQSMSDFQTSLIQMAFYGAYFCFALPAALFIRRFSYKSGVLLGLGLFIIGGLLFFPASQTMQYGHFLVALYVLAGGLSILETSANPYVIAIGPAETGTQRLNLAQSFNPIGSIMGVVVSQVFILSELRQLSPDERAALAPDALRAIQADELAAVMGPYVAVSVILVVIWLLIALRRMPVVAEHTDGQPLHLAATFGRLLRNRRYLWGVVAQFFYVGAQIGVWSYTIRYVMQALDLDEAGAASYYIAALVLFTVSRFVCTWLMTYIPPARLLLLLALLATALTGLAILADGYTGVLALTGISGCMSLMFPTIYGGAVRGLGADTKIGGAGLIMAILGGAVLTALQGWVSDSTGSIHLSFLVPMACFVVVAVYARVAMRR
ncbi:MAG: L-fucose:H+ symporter permease [Bacteroidia bacterium]